ncbi:MAG: Hsp20/alpha crystallin family protein [Hadesarchaea archaeon]|nr:Hsp20/alpha crystallin family protein [Hadesarchaea archaeon]
MDLFDFDEFFRRMRRMFKDFEREFDEVDLREFMQAPGISGFKIEIRDYGTGKPDIKITRLGKHPPRIAPISQEIPEPERKEVEAKPIKPIKRMLETNVGKVERPDKVVLTMQVSDVDKEDVEVRQFGNTLEVIARRRTGEAYFAAFELPSDAVPDEREVEIKDGLLTIIVPRSRRYPRTGI